MALHPGTHPDILPTLEGYERWSAVYDADENPLVQLEERHVPRLLGDVNGRQVADLGCGTGRHAVRLARHGADVTAVDFSPGMVQRAEVKEGWDRVRFVDHDLRERLPFPDAAFDRVLSCLVLDHMPDLRRAFREFRRVCRTDGFILVSAPHPAMALRGVQARFIDPDSGDRIQLASTRHELSNYVMAALEAGLAIDHFSEHVVDEALARNCARAEKYLGWPMLVVMRLLPR